MFFYLKVVKSHFKIMQHKTLSFKTVDVVTVKSSSKYYIYVKNCPEIYVSRLK